MTTRGDGRAGRRGDVLLGLATAAYVAGATVLAVSPLRPVDRVALVQTFALFACGALIVRRTDTPAIGWLLIVPGVTFNLLYAAPPWASTATGDSVLLPLGQLGIAALGLLLLVFPTGRLQSRAARVAAVVLVAGQLAQLVADSTNLFGIIELGWVVPAGVIGFSTFIGVVLFGLVDQGVRYRRRPRVEQLQVKWFLVAIAGQLAYLVLALAGIGDDTMAFVVVDNLATTLWPVTILFAITRYRLYEVDRIISRTVGYMLVVASLLGLGVGTLALVTTVLPSQGRFVTAVVTVLVVAVSGPVRRRVLDVVDRRFDRTRYVARQVVEDFGHTVADEIDLDELRGRLDEVLRTTLAPATVAVWEPEATR